MQTNWTFNFYLKAVNELLLRKIREIKKMRTNRKWIDDNFRDLNVLAKEIKIFFSCEMEFFLMCNFWRRHWSVSRHLSFILSLACLSKQSIPSDQIHISLYSSSSPFSTSEIVYRSYRRIYWNCNENNEIEREREERREGRR